MTALITLALGLAGGVPLGAWLRLRLLCGPMCTGPGFDAAVEAVELAAWERGATTGVAYQRGELAGTRVENRVWRLLTQRRDAVEEPDDEPDRVVAA